MEKVRRYLRLPPDWEELGDEELERLCDRADRVKEILPELPPLKGGTTSRRSVSTEDEVGEETLKRKSRPDGVDRETTLDQQDELGD